MWPNQVLRGTELGWRRRCPTKIATQMGALKIEKLMTRKVTEEKTILLWDQHAGGRDWGGRRRNANPEKGLFPKLKGKK